MTDVRLPASGNIMIRWHADGAFVNPARPTPAEINAGLKIGVAVSWNDFAFGTEASNTIDDPAITSKSNVTDRGAMQYGGTLSMYYPKVYDDASNAYSVVYDALAQPRTTGWISLSVDGELSETNTATYTGGMTQTAAVGDLVSVYKVMTAGYAEAITGEEAFRYTITFRPQGEAYPYTVIGTASTVVALPATATPAAGAVLALSATVDGRPYTRGVRWTTSDPTVATVSQNGIVTIVGATTDTATITATFEAASTTDTVAITVA